MTTEYTQNFRLALPDFRMGPWHDLVNGDFTKIDELLMGLYQGVDTRPWTNNTLFTVGMTAIDTSDQTFWVCSVTHTSAPAPTTFAQDRAAHPTYWNRVVVGIAPRGEWQNDTLYLVNDMAVDSVAGIIAICKIEHISSPAPATIRDDAAKWVFLVDIGGVNVQAVNVDYDGTVSGSSTTNVQDALDEAFSEIDDLTVDFAALESDLTTLDDRVTATENKNNEQDDRLTDAEGELAAHNTRIETLEIVGPATSAAAVSYNPVNGEPYTNVQDGLSAIYVAGQALNVRVADLEDDENSAVYISDTPPVAPGANSLWWESDTGTLYIRYNDGDSSQWVSVVPSITPIEPGASLPIVNGAANTGVSPSYSREDHIHPSDTSRVAKAGDTMTGNLQISANDPTFVLNKVAGAHQNTLVGSVGNLTRWLLHLGDNTAETGAHAGSNFALFPYSDAGAALSGVPALKFIRATNLGEVAGPPTTANGIATKAYVDNIPATPFDAMAYSGMQINGGMEVSQFRGASILSLINNNNLYVIDGFYSAYGHAAATAAFSVAQVDGGINIVGNGYYSKYLYMACSAALTAPAVGDYAIIAQYIEGFRTARLGWGTGVASPVTIGFWVITPIPGTGVLAVRNQGATRNYLAEFTTTTANWEYKTITIPGDIAGTWQKTNLPGMQLIWCFASGTNWRGTAGVWQAGNFFSTPAQTNFFSAAPRTAYITGVTVIPGSSGPSAARSSMLVRPFNDELALAQRYWEKSYDYDTAIGTNTGAGAAANYINLSAVPVYYGLLTAEFKVAKRSSPTMTSYSAASGAPGFIRDAWSGGDVAATILTSGNRSVTWYGAPIGPPTVLSLQNHWVADARF